MRPVGVDCDRALGAGGVVVSAAPGVVFGFGDEASFDWIAVEVAEFLEAFGFGVDVEVVVADLPELVACAEEEFRGLLFEDFEGGGEVVVGGFGEEEVDVFGHEDVAVDLYVVLPFGFDRGCVRRFVWGGSEARKGRRW